MPETRFATAPRSGGLTIFATLVLALACAACSSFGMSSEPEPEIPQTIEGLEAEIEASREALTDIVSRPDEHGDLDARAAALGEISARLALLQDALTDLELESQGKIHEDPEDRLWK
jgi:hypothetical protein